MRWLSSLLVLICAGPAAALPPTETGRGFVDGANHHLGDVSYLERFGHAPGDGHAEEALRMRTHLRYVRSWLGARPATKPELTPRREALLGYLDDYIAKGTTPINTDVPWRSPVFVDVLGNVCAVGYLIERSVGRELVERIAARHRFDFLEDIAMPEVAAWVASSGFTLEELASIQPGYQRPVIEEWRTWDLRKQRPTNGPWAVEAGGVTTRGTWRAGAMHGLWQRLDSEGHVIGSGDFVSGRGHWTSRDEDGAKIAEGPFRRSQPEGQWRFFHRSGRVAAEGPMRRGQRHGAWTFYHDASDAAGKPLPLARGRFERGRVHGTWRHFDTEGKAFARTWAGVEEPWGMALRTSLERRDGLAHEVLSGNFAGDSKRVDALELQGVRLFVNNEFREQRSVASGEQQFREQRSVASGEQQFREQRSVASGEQQIDEPAYFDVDGYELTRDALGWKRGGCAWSASMRRAAHQGKVEQVMNHVLGRAAATGPCEEARVDAATGQVFDRITALTRQVRTPTPAFIIAMTETDEFTPDPELRELLVDNMSWYIEWPHVDLAFARVFVTLPGHYSPELLEDFETSDDYTLVSSAAGTRVFFR